MGDGGTMLLSGSEDHSKPDIWIAQPAYTRSILQRFGMEKAKAVNTPVDTSIKQQKTPSVSINNSTDQLSAVCCRDKTRYHICSEE